MSRSRSIIVAECVVVPVMSDSMSESVSETVRVRVSVPRGVREFGDVAIAIDREPWVRETAWLPLRPEARAKISRARVDGLAARHRLKASCL